MAMQIIQDRNGKITGYKLFDQNYGEYDCTHGSPEANLQAIK
jgi:hypothetical protein